jgi:hypothetical protein
VQRNYYDVGTGCKQDLTVSAGFAPDHFLFTIYSSFQILNFLYLTIFCNDGRICMRRHSVPNFPVAEQGGSQIDTPSLQHDLSLRGRVVLFHAPDQA